MKMKILALALAAGLLSSSAFSQTGFSESDPFKPSDFAKADKKKKSEKKKNVEPVSGPVPLAAGSGPETVVIPISVFDKTGTFITGITKADVSVLVDGTEVPVETFGVDDKPINVVLVLDTSPSAAQRLKTMQDQASKFVQSLPANANVMVIDFNSELNVRSKMTADRSETHAAISKVKMGGGTSLYSAIRTVYEKVLPHVGGRKVIVLMTDGVDTTSSSSTYENSLLEVESGDVTIYPIYYDTFEDRVKGSGFRGEDWIVNILRQSGTLTPATGASGPEYQRGLAYIKDLAAASGGRMFSSEKLESATGSFNSELAAKYYATISVPKKAVGRRQLRVRINRPGLAVFARGSFIDR